MPGTPVDAERTRAEGNDLKQPTGHREILQEVNHLILVGEVVVETECRGDGEDRHDACHDPRLKADDKKHPAAELDGDRNQVAQSR